MQDVNLIETQRVPARPIRLCISGLGFRLVFNGYRPLTWERATLPPIYLANPFEGLVDYYVTKQVVMLLALARTKYGLENGFLQIHRRGLKYNVDHDHRNLRNRILSFLLERTRFQIQENTEIRSLDFIINDKFSMRTLEQVFPALLGMSQEHALTTIARIADTWQVPVIFIREVLRYHGFPYDKTYVALKSFRSLDKVPTLKDKSAIDVMEAFTTNGLVVKTTDDWVDPELFKRNILKSLLALGVDSQNFTNSDLITWSSNAAQVYRPADDTWGDISGLTPVEDLDEPPPLETEDEYESTKIRSYAELQKLAATRRFGRTVPVRVVTAQEQFQTPQPVSDIGMISWEFRKSEPNYRIEHTEELVILHRDLDPEEQKNCS